MKTAAFAFTALRREARSGELIVLAAALAIAVTSLTAIGFLTDRIAQAVSLQAAEVLAADIRLRSAREMDEATLASGRELGLETAETLTFPSVVFAGERNALATIKAVGPGYPLRGAVRIAEEIFGAERTVDGLPPPGAVWADDALLARIGARVGERVEVGASTLVVDAVLTYRPDQTPGFAGLAPSLLMNLGDVPATGLVQTGSRVSHAQLFAGDRQLVVPDIQGEADVVGEPTSGLAQQGPSLDVDPTRIAVGGDSAGGNLAAAVALLARERGGPALLHQLLVYPVTHHCFDTKSYAENAQGYLLTRDMMQWFWGHYLEDEADGRNPVASPLLAPDLGGLPRATVVTAQYDPLRDEGEAYVTRLREAGVAARLTRYDGMFHGFFAMPHAIDAARTAVDEAGRILQESFAR